MPRCATAKPALIDLYRQWWPALKAEEAASVEIEDFAVKRRSPVEQAALGARVGELTRTTRALVREIMCTPAITDADLAAIADMAFFYGGDVSNMTPEDFDKPAHKFEGWQHIVRLARELKRRAPDVEFFGLQAALETADADHAGERFEQIVSEHTRN